jgi:hypothetical protein
VIALGMQIAAGTAAYVLVLVLLGEVKSRDVQLVKEMLAGRWTESLNV